MVRIWRSSNCDPSSLGVFYGPNIRSFEENPVTFKSFDLAISKLIEQQSAVHRISEYD